MSKIIPVLLAISILLIAIATATCYYGPEYDRSLIPPEPEDFTLYDGGDPSVGDRWIMIGTLILCVGIGLGLGAIIVWLRERGRGANSADP